MKTTDLDNGSKQLTQSMLVTLLDYTSLHRDNRKNIDLMFKHEFEKPYFAQVFALINAMPDSSLSIGYIESVLNDFKETLDLHEDFDLRSHPDKYLLDLYNGVVAQLELICAAEKSYNQYKKNLEG